jgi:hypothetical protein
MYKEKDGVCKCGHKMHSLKPPHKCWQSEVGTCNCEGYEGQNGESFSDSYFRGGPRYDSGRACPSSIASNPKA